VAQVIAAIVLLVMMAHSIQQVQRKS
jgi:hypothetical protein